MFLIPPLFVSLLVSDAGLDVALVNSAVPYVLCLIVQINKVCGYIKTKANKQNKTDIIMNNCPLVGLPSDPDFLNDFRGNSHDILHGHLWCRQDESCCFFFFYGGACRVTFAFLSEIPQLLADIDVQLSMT